jgi:hypothetical protein
MYVDLKNRYSLTSPLLFRAQYVESDAHVDDSTAEGIPAIEGAFSIADYAIIHAASTALQATVRSRSVFLL